MDSKVIGNRILAAAIGVRSAGAARRCETARPLKARSRKWSSRRASARRTCRTSAPRQRAERGRPRASLRHVDLQNLAECGVAKRRHRRPAAGPGQPGRDLDPRRRHDRRREELRSDRRVSSSTACSSARTRARCSRPRPAERRDPAGTAGHAVRSQLDRRRHQRITRQAAAPRSSAAAARAGYGNYDDLQLDGYLERTAGRDVRIQARRRIRGSATATSTTGRSTGRGRDGVQLGEPVASCGSRPKRLELYYRFDKSWQDQDANTVNNKAQPDQVFCAFVTTGATGQAWCVYYAAVRASLAEPQCRRPLRRAAERRRPRSVVLRHGACTCSTRLRRRRCQSSSSTCSVTSRRTREVYQDWDGTPLTLYHTERPARTAQRSHELR